MTAVTREMYSAPLLIGFIREISGKSFVPITAMIGPEAIAWTCREGSRNLASKAGYTFPILSDLQG